MPGESSHLRTSTVSSTDNHQSSSVTPPPPPPSPQMNTSNEMPLLVSVLSVRERVIPFNGTATLKPRSLSSVLPDDRTAFFQYRGSLTTPGCQESVDWLIFEHHSHVIVSQVSRGAGGGGGQTGSHEEFRWTSDLFHKTL